MFGYWTWFIFTGITGSLCLIAIPTFILIGVKSKDKRDTSFAIAGGAAFLLIFCLMGFATCGSMIYG